jgi:hypothetical protein
LSAVVQGGGRDFLTDPFNSVIDSGLDKPENLHGIGDVFETTARWNKGFVIGGPGVRLIAEMPLTSSGSR